MRNSCLLYVLLSFQAAGAQINLVPFDLPQYNFINYQVNEIELIRDNPSYHVLFAKFDTLIQKGSNQINIVHIGGSHIQADIYTHRIRQELQAFYPGILGSRGFFFPCKIAGTNSPLNLRISYTGIWQSVKNTEPEPAFVLGLSGFTSELTGSDGSLQVVASYDSLQHYDFNRIRLFCNVTSAGKMPEFRPETLVSKVSVNLSGGFVQYNLSGYADTLNLFIHQPDSLSEPFQLYGISLENDDPGVIYNSIGVNGAMLKSYLQCSLFTRQLAALDPDWVIISIGTNEGNTREFDKENYRLEYIRLIDSVRKAAPGAALLLTVPNDSWLFKRYINHNTAEIREVIYDLARIKGCGVWDFYTIMGGLNSAMYWYNSGLMSRDHIHFNKPGYYLKGDLFYAAFLNSWNDPSFTHPMHIPSRTPQTSSPSSPCPLSLVPIPIP